MTEAILFISILVVATLVFLTLQYSLLLPPKKGLPIPMYHRISDHHADGLTVTSEQFERQLGYLRKQGYRSLDFATLAKMRDSDQPLTGRHVIITFDDAYLNFRDLALPLLKKRGFRASVFVPVAYIGKINAWDRGNDPLMDAADLKRLVLNGEIEAGLHSFLHRNYTDMTSAEIHDDLEQCRSTLQGLGIPFVRVLAYPYGAYPKREAAKREEMFGVFRRFKLEFALRIGNRVNRWPLANPYEVKRIDIRGTDSDFIFRTKVRKGRAKLFS